jgi:hypothetical protein
MNIEEFKERYANFKDIDRIEIACDHPQHNPKGEMISIGKQPAKRNILKNDGKQFICKQCYLRHNNPMNHLGENRQTDEIIKVYCPHPEHSGDPAREMKKRNYYGVMQEPFLQTCKSCAQLGKEISEEQREKIRLALTGITRSDEFKKKLSDYMKNNPEGIARATKNIIENRGCGFLGKHHTDEAKKRMSETMNGREYTEEHCENISEGRKKMLAETGGFTREHREAISRAVIEQYKNGFEPKLHHLRGWHESPKAGRVFYRSSYEKKAYLKLDADEFVVTYKAESVAAEYFHPVKKITSTTLIDIEVEYTDGTKKLIEIKPLSWLKDEVIKAKLKAGHTKAEELGIQYEVWTEMSLFGHVYNEKNMRSFAEKVKQGLL